MALRKRTSNERLFVLEVFVEGVNLRPEGTLDENEDLIVRVKFTDLPRYELRVPKSNQGDRTKFENEPKFGKSCLFVETPRNLIEAIGRALLRLEMYRDGSRNVLLGTSKIRLPVCMRDQVLAARNRGNESAAPCLVRESFDLTDSSGLVCGSVSVGLRLSCFGSAFILEDSPLRKFLRSAHSDTGSTEVSLKRPDSPPRVSINDPDFKRLTMAEKLNDPKFRELVYRAYPDEPTCRCLPPDRSTHPMECRSGCNRPCCWKLRNTKIVPATKEQRDEPSLEPSATVYRIDDANTPRSLRCANRLRGGGDVEQIYAEPNGGRGWPDYEADRAWHGERNVARPRFETGGKENVSSCSCSGGVVPVTRSRSTERNTMHIFDACKPRVTSTGPRAGCVCPGKDTETHHTGIARCSKDPCMGVDCLVRAFQEAQEFVDSIGRVPGLPGLGLMDPSESPFFGRDRDRDYLPRETERRKLHTAVPQTTPSSSCAAACNVQRVASGEEYSRVPLPYATNPPLGTLVLPPRLGIVREAIPVLPEVVSRTSKPRKRDEKKEERCEKQKDHDVGSSALMDTEVGPCGEPRCKSRRKKPVETSNGTYNVTHVSSKTRTDQVTAKDSKKPRAGRYGNKRPGNAQPRGRVGFYERGGATVGPGGDRDRPGTPAIKVRKSIMRFVYFVGDHYPGINFGHRDCIDIRMRVPRNMGWLWNTMATVGKLKPRIGWKPGAINRYVYELMQEAKENTFLEWETSSVTTTKSAERGKTTTGRGRTSPTDRGRSGRRRMTIERGKMSSGRGRVDRGRVAGDRVRSGTSGPRTPPRRRSRRVSEAMSRTQATMGDEQEETDNPPTLHIHRKDGTYYVTMYPIGQETVTESRLSEPIKPLQFKIVKNKDDASVASSSSASDMEIEFSPPAAVTRNRKKPDVVHVDTQVRQQEILDAVKAEIAKGRDRRGRRERKTKPESAK
ncbi:uncharacterized protein LOC143145928 [Ptiloglossa arizonensis]|uniref:uncharacterized protein LOC143145928 n=1 Tax=Ptiloglossa arizonensis TaxID=3350558 RepID=UPI003F9F12AC